ncbi:ABC transporter permease [Vreelandella populi]|uniref:ABC transporter permease n=1 Tax=Vreelandella populi TaxID=2498858 RepID=A0A3S0YX31_9GAMM|nr:ABC transporter permease [Halomonas populi]RUR43393.1 ABC transporter permease [Halomonas populi]
MRLPNSAQWQLALPLSIFYIAFFAAPLMLLIGVSFFNDEMLTQPGLESWKRFVGDAFYWKVTFDTIKLGVYTVCATILIGYPLALVYVQAGPRAKRILLFIILMPMLLSVVVRTFAWIVILSEQGVINQTIMPLGLTSTPIRLLQTELGLVISLTQIEMPLMLLPLISVMARIDPNLIDASTSLGASRWGTLFKVIVPLSFPGLIAGCILVFASSTTAFISHSIIGGNRLIYLPLMIWQQASVLYNWPLAAVGAIVLLVFVSLCIALVTLVGKRSMRHLYV